MATVEQVAAHVADNLLQVIQFLVQSKKLKWSNVKSVCIKTRSSVALPVYNALDLSSDQEDEEPNAAPAQVSMTEEQRKTEEDKQEVRQFMKDLMKKVGIKL